MAERVVAAGYKATRPIVDGTNFMKDPDGYTIELYRRPAAISGLHAGASEILVGRLAGPIVDRLASVRT
jgi:hypothetical protein